MCLRVPEHLEAEIFKQQKGGGGVSESALGKSQVSKASMGKGVAY